MQSKVTVIMSVYNTDFVFVRRAIDSVLNQSFQDFELLIIDDGSDDGYQHQLLDYVIKNQTKISYIWHTNRGQANSINKAIRISNGRYISIIDADDEYMPNHLSSCLQEITNADLIASTTNTIVDNESDFYVPCKDNLDKLIHIDDCILFATLFGKKEVFMSLNFQNMYSADSNFYYRASEMFTVKKVNLRTYTYYRNSKSSICSKLKIAATSN